MTCTAVPALPCMLGVPSACIPASRAGLIVRRLPAGPLYAPPTIGALYLSDVYIGASKSYTFPCTGHFSVDLRSPSTGAAANKQLCDIASVGWSNGMGGLLFAVGLLHLASSATVARTATSWTRTVTNATVDSATGGCANTVDNATNPACGVGGGEFEIDLYVPHGFP
jgi:hypothetical protein